MEYIYLTATLQAKGIAALNAYYTHRPHILQAPNTTHTCKCVSQIIKRGRLDVMGKLYAVI